MVKKLFFQFAILLICFSLCSQVNAQNTRIQNYNTIGWYNFFGNFKLNNKWGIHAEYQWRREDLITNWQQSLFRVGGSFQLNPKVQLRLGYAWVETFPYGDIPINGFGKQFTNAADSISSNIAEGYGRYFIKENINFCFYSRGSILETKN